ncbi:MAG: phosphoglycerate kinase [Bacilli bacterium]
MKNVKDLNVKGLTVLVRCDFNVPFIDGKISDDNRIVAALPTIKELISKGAKVFLMSHLGKIDYKKTPEEIEKAKKKNSLAPVAVRLSELLGQEVKFCPVTHGEELKEAVESLHDGEVLLMQNTRYEKGESKNDPALSAEWASLCDAFVMDAFGSAHRAHASTFGVPEILNKEGKQTAIGFLVEKEVKSLGRVISVTEEQRPYVAILGGFKVSDKIKVINSLVKKCDKIIIGGAMAYTFLKALGKNIGSSPCEEDQLEYAKEMYATGKVMLPVDVVVANDFSNPTEIKTVSVDEIPDGFEGMDIGAKTMEMYRNEILKAHTVFWNGPMGVFEQEAFQAGTKAVCQACADIKDYAFTVIGGGDSASACKQFGYKDDFSHVSTGGGASLEMIENDGHLPGIDVIGE